MERRKSTKIRSHLKEGRSRMRSPCLDKFCISLPDPKDSNEGEYIIRAFYSTTLHVILAIFM